MHFLALAQAVTLNINRNSSLSGFAAGVSRSIGKKGHVTFGFVKLGSLGTLSVCFGNVQMREWSALAVLAIWSRCITGCDSGVFASFDSIFCWFSRKFYAGLR